MGDGPRTVRSITADLRRLGVREGDVLWVHASLRRIGPVERGAEGLLDALHEAVGPAGTIVMTVGARDDWSWVNERAESERAALLRDAEPFDPAVTPADPEVGVLAEVFRVRGGTIVSDNPEGRIGASGRLARALIEDAPWDDYYGPGSPLERFVDAGGRVLRLGADPDTVTLLHYAEYLVALPAKRAVTRYRRVRGSHGPEVRVVRSLDDSDGIVERSGEDYFTTILDAYLTSGSALTGRVGRAGSELIDGRDLVDFAVSWMAAHLSEPSVQ